MGGGSEELLRHGQKNNVYTQLTSHPVIFPFLIFDSLPCHRKVIFTYIHHITGYSLIQCSYTSTSSSRIPVSHITQHSVIVQHGFSKVAGVGEIILQVG